MFPRVPDQHKPSKPLVPNGLGVIYALASATYLFILYTFGSAEIESYANVSPALTLAVCILFGGFMGLLDDWIDLRWRYKAFLPLIAAIPLVSFAMKLELRTAVTIPLFGTIDFGLAYYFLIIPLIVTITTNTVNQLGGLNGLETVCPAIIMGGLAFVSYFVADSKSVLLCVPLIVLILLAFFNFQGKIFVGNTGSFAVGLTLAAFAIISDLKYALIISLLPYIFNSSLILLTYFIFRAKAQVSFDGKKLFSNHKRSLITVITYNRPLTERQVVTAISLLVATSTALGLLAQLVLF